MRFPSLSALLLGARQVCRRFPMSVLAACLAGTAACVLVDFHGEEIGWVRLLMASQLGVPLLLALSLWAESRNLRASRRWPLLLVAGALLIVYGISIPDVEDENVFARFFQFNLAAHLMVAFLPFLGWPRSPSFWIYNLILFLRFLVSALFTFVLFAGLSVALVALDQLFGVNIEGEVYPRLFMLLAFIFNTLYFLGGVPGQPRELGEVRIYPTGLRVFAQYILAPLVALYLLLLTAYLGKVLLTTSWPSGWIGWLVSSVAAAGLLSLLLLHPVIDRQENRWVASYSRLYYILLLPAIGMLLAAIFKRVSQYGITENRYFLMVLASWLAGIAVYALFTGARRIRIIPTSLCVVALLSSFGPWGAYSVSRASQQGRLVGLLERNGMLVDGIMSKATTELSAEDQREISAACGYLVDRHGVPALASMLPDTLASSLDAVADSTRRQRWQARSRTRRLIANHLGLDPASSGFPEDRWFNYVADGSGAVLPLGGADYSVRLLETAVGPWSYDIDGRLLNIEYDADSMAMILRMEGMSPLSLELEELFDGVHAELLEGDPGRPVPAELLRASAAHDSLVVLMQLDNLHGRRDKDGLTLNRVNGQFLLTFPRE